MKRRFGNSLVISLLLAVLIITAFPVSALAATGGVTDSEALQDLALLRQATVRYKDVNNAIADGFFPMGECTMNADGSAGMGIHFINFDRVINPDITLLEPEVLLYVPTEDGLKLVGVEYFLPIGPTNFIPPDAPPPPVLFGRSFDGPMFGHDEGMPSHYDLHVWLWEANPLGMFTAFNPNVKCP